MNLKELIKDVERLNHKQYKYKSYRSPMLQGIKQTAEAVDYVMTQSSLSIQLGYFKDWQKLRKLLGVK